MLDSRPLDEAPRHIPFVETARFGVRGGNAVRPLVDGLRAFRRIGHAVGRARKSVCVTIAFIHDDFVLPDGLGTLFDLLDAASRRGVDVRALFWRPNPEAGIEDRSFFEGNAAQREALRRRGSCFGMRWDRAPGAYCHHQKSWVVDAGEREQVAFVGGMNLNPSYVVAPGHQGDRCGAHDLYLEVTGPAVADVHCNFVERWNAASERAAADGCWGELGASDMAGASERAEACGRSLVQIQRTLPVAGERDILAQYEAAIDAARRSVYIENQALEDETIVQRLCAAVERGVLVVALLPPELETPAARSALAALSGSDRFVRLALSVPAVGLARRRGATRTGVHVHAKVMLVDDCFATVGSCNIRHRAFHHHSELNASFQDSAAVRALRCELLREHLGLDTSALDDVAALSLMIETARDNAGRTDDWQGIVYAPV